MSTKPKEPAYPFRYESEYGDEGMTRTVIMPGLTKREYFAAMAMQGLCANYLRENVQGWNPESYAKESVIIADALIKALNETQNQQQ